MGAAWRGPKDKDLEQVTEMIRAVKALGLETCVTLGMLKEGQAEKLKAAGLDYYNHNLDTAPEFYGNIVTTHSQADRFDTLAQGARGRHQRLLRRHRRHGRDAPPAAPG
jgi:biotin synthase